jgi:hypothetical protein
LVEYGRKKNQMVQRCYAIIEDPKSHDLIVLQRISRWFLAQGNESYTLEGHKSITEKPSSCALLKVAVEVSDGLLGRVQGAMKGKVSVMTVMATRSDRQAGL